MKNKEIFDKEFYIIDCENFTYFARKVHVIGFGADMAHSEMEYMIDIPNPYKSNEYRTMYLWELTRFKTFEDAQKKAEYYNNIPKNKKIREDYINNMQKFLEMKYIVGDE